MAVKILEGTGEGESRGAVLFCSTTEWAFGPVFNSAQEAMDFLEYCSEPRTLTEAELLDAVHNFRVSCIKEDEAATSVTSPT